MDRAIIDQIRNANDIVDVISSYIPLKNAGSNHRGLCPFHKDSNPSLNVSRSKQIYKCFACGNAGNVFTFVQEYEKLSFIEAVKKLAQRAGIVIPASERTKVVSTKREQLLEIYRSAKDFFAANLFNHGAHVLKYLEERSFSRETAKTLELGYSLNSEKALLNHLLKEGYSVSLLRETGLFASKEGNVLDMFRERLMFPIHNSTGEVVAFGGRILETSNSTNKYLNSPGTELYTKGNELYGLFKTRYDIGQKKYALVSEGYFDFLRLYESGFNNSVASLGTALTDQQAYLLLRYCKKINMLYDGDSSGIKAAVKAGLICLSKGMEVSIVSLPDNQDPDSFILKEGREAMQDLIENASPLISYLAGTKKLEQGSSERIDLLLDSLRQIKDMIQRELLLKEAAEAFGVSMSALNSRLHRSTAPVTQAQPENSPVSPRLEEYREERQLLITALKDSESYNLLASELSSDYFNSKLYRTLYTFLIEHATPDIVDNPSILLDNIENKEIKESLAELLFEDLQDLRFEDALVQVKIRKIQRELDDLDRMIEREPQNLELLNRKKSLSQMYRRMTKKVVNKVRFFDGHI